MKKTRIIKTIHLDGSETFTIQQKHFIFWWWWVDAWINSSSSWTKDTFKTLNEAKNNLKYFDGSKPKKEIVKL
jgi:hypothetical protein